MITPSEVNCTRSASLYRVASILAILAVAVPHGQAQRAFSKPEDAQAVAQQTQHQEKLQQVLNDRAAYANTIVERWEDAAKASGRWDANFANDLKTALLKLTPDNLLAAGEAPSFEAMMQVLATGKFTQAVSPDALGDIADDLVFTPIPLCRIVDTRNAGGAIAANTTRNFDVDGSTFVGQGGVNASCGIPFGVAQAVAMTIHVIQPAANGTLRAWRYLSPQPAGTLMNYAAGQALANTAIVPVFPGAGPDFSVSPSATAHVVVDVAGYFAAPVATALDCTTVSSPMTVAPVNVWTPITASCPAGRTATGGGYDTPEGTLGYPGVWLTTLPNGNGWITWVDNQTNGGRNIQTFVRCCRVPGR
ncbi:MAG TPA: hypothetical protein VH601_10295 [Bryobacteraceae bacterium]|jgi:hypothetical protein